MEENQALVGELRRYLNSAQKTPDTKETEQVQALKHDLNLAARVGQQLLMQLHSTELQRDKGYQEIEKLRIQNHDLSRENQRLASEHGALSESLNEQEQQIQNLIEQLATAQQRANKLARATAAAKALEREVHLLEQIQADLRRELEQEQRKPSSNEADMSSGELAALRLAQSVEQGLAELKLTEVENSLSLSMASVPSLTDGTTYDIQPSQMATPKNIRSNWREKGWLGKPDVIKTDEVDFTQENVVAGSSSTPLRHPAGSKTDEMPFSPITPASRPRMRHARSHESVLSIIPSPPQFAPFIKPASSVTPVTAPDIVGPTPDTVTTQRTTATAYHSSQLPVRSAARDKLSQMRGVPPVEIRRPERRWAFTPFRM